MKLVIVAGARSNFIKIAPLIEAIRIAQKRGNDIEYRIVHTGLHYDEKMSTVFFKELNIPEPDINLGCGGGTKAEQTAAIMISFEKELMEHAADFFVIPSMREAFGQTCLEAMAWGIPAVGFNGGGIPDMIKDGHTGYLALERDELSLAEALAKILSDVSEQKEMGINARKYVLDNFTLDLQSEKYMKIYSQLLNKYF